MQRPDPDTPELELVICSVQAQYVDDVDDIFAAHDSCDYVRHPRAEGRDQDGRHRGSKVFPGNMASFVAYVPAHRLDALLEALRAFRDAREAHAHLRAAVLSADRVL